MTAVTSQTGIQAVGLGEIFTGSGTGKLVAYGLGSCIGVCVYDPGSNVGGLAHVMLPENMGGKAHPDMPGRYADSAITNLIEMVTSAGADRGKLQARISGGAQMLSAPGLSDKFNIGARNAVMVKAELKKNGVRVKGEDIGGQAGRTLSPDLGSGMVTVKTLGASGPLTL